MEDLLPYDFDPADDAPDWTLGGRVHNWRNHVGTNTRAVWASLTREQREAVAKDADVAAGNEEWE